MPGSEGRLFTAEYRTYQVPLEAGVFMKVNNWETQTLNSASIRKKGYDGTNRQGYGYRGAESDALARRLDVGQDKGGGGSTTSNKLLLVEQQLFPTQSVSE